MAQWLKLVPPLVTAAIHVCSGNPVSGVATLTSGAGAVFAEILGNRGATQALRKQVAESISEWATSEGLDDHLDLGVRLAGDMAQKYALPQSDMAAARYEPAAVVADCLARARRDDPYWGTEGHYAVAEEALRITFEILVRAEARSPGGLADLLRSVATQQDRLASDVKSILGARAAPDLADPRVVLAVRAYLRARVADWDSRPAWLGYRSPTRLTCPLRVTRQHDQHMTEAEALNGASVLLVTGGPGSGKTWLSQRYARVAAEEALERISAGEALSAVELPVWTTFEAWASQRESAKAGLVHSSFDAALGMTVLSDSAVAVEGLLTRLFLETPVKVLAVVDSLDEGSRSADLTGLLGTLTTLPSLGWRVVATSRPGAWEQSRPPRRDGDGTVREVEVRPLRFPEDVKNVIDGWFGQATDAAERLMAEFHGRDDLKDAACVPLLLAFVCLLAESNQELPSHRRDLYRSVCLRLLTPRWRQKHAETDLGGCMRLLADWAGKVARDSDPVSGLGSWSDSFATTEFVSEALQPTDNVAPTLAVTPEGHHIRRFIHRSVLEYFVAEHAASLPAREACELLIPHLWFDKDWEWAAPAAIATHPQRNDILPHLISLAEAKGKHWLCEEANNALDNLVVAVAAESSRTDWDNECRDLIQERRAKTAVAGHYSVTRSTGWDGVDDQRVPDALVGALPHADAADAESLLSILSRLAMCDGQREEAIQEIGRRLKLARSASADSNDRFLGHHLAWMITQFATTDDLRHKSIRAILDALLTAEAQTNPKDEHESTHVLQQLIDGDAELLRAVVAEIAGKPNLHPQVAEDMRYLVDADTPLDPEMRDNCRTIIDNALADAKNGFEIVGMMHWLEQVGSTPALRHKALAALSHRLPEATTRELSSIAPVLLSLGPSKKTRNLLRSRILKGLPDANEYECGLLVRVLAELDLSRRAKESATATLWNRLFGLEATVSLWQTLLSTEEQAELCDTLRTLMKKWPPAAVLRVADAMVRLSPTEADRADAIRAITGVLPRLEAERANECMPLLESWGADQATLGSARQIVISRYTASSEARNYDLHRRAKELAALRATHGVNSDNTDAAMSAMMGYIFKALRDPECYYTSELVGDLVALGFTESHPAFTDVSHSLVRDKQGIPTLKKLLHSCEVHDSTRADLLPRLVSLMATIKGLEEADIQLLCSLATTDHLREETIPAVCASLTVPQTRWIYHGSGFQVFRLSHERQSREPQGIAMALPLISANDSLRKHAIEAGLEALSAAHQSQLMSLAWALVQMDVRNLSTVVNEIKSRRDVDAETLIGWTYTVGILFDPLQPWLSDALMERLHAVEDEDMRSLSLALQRVGMGEAARHSLAMALVNGLREHDRPSEWILDDLLRVANTRDLAENTAGALADIGPVGRRVATTVRSLTSVDAWTGLLKRD
ncbi:MAG: hypothetical protein LBK42_03580 [Propionibacteriaceae bacterium]|jgi:hypothetical protein|nr:hypothetical protein [Propionibacteriaceae bacterium]